MQITDMDHNQKIAVQSCGLPTKIIAGAGSGKTRTVINRIIYGVTNFDYEPSSILALTFTKKAADEMRERLAKEGVPVEDSKNEIEGVTVGTFHSVCLQILQKFWFKLSKHSLPPLLIDKTQILKEVMKEYKENDASIEKNTEKNEQNSFEMKDPQILKMIAEQIGYSKIMMLSPADYANNFNDFLYSEDKRENTVLAVSSKTIFSLYSPNQFAEIFKLYEIKKTQLHYIDFEDILILAAHLIKNYTLVSDYVFNKYDHFYTDESQDISLIQEYLLYLFTLGKKDVCVVGDPNQTIYTFAGANPNFLREFPTNLSLDCLPSDLSKVNLNINYRSKHELVEFGNIIICNSDFGEGIDLVSNRESGANIYFQRFINDDEEAVAVIDRIKYLLNNTDLNPSDIAILTRVNLQQPVFVNELKKQKINYRFIKKGTDISTDATDAINIGTMHSVKGLEFKAVFIPGMSEGFMPYMLSDTPESMREERRLLYVAITRAMDSLYISYATGKGSAQKGNRRLTRFLKLIWPQKSKASQYSFYKTQNTI
ncbi:MAG: ATP-dependent helicase [Bifidobacteriaceae bacterium]|jgi:DNA helicase-2/ATP-dependent DNA helicase PcrA|nr:ATP-dependent helicase [Bifidobacteriaceae bacterium]